MSTFSQRVCQITALALLLTACGQKGPLYVPGAKKTPVTPIGGAPAPSTTPPDATPLAPGTALDPQPAPTAPAPSTDPQQQKKQQQQSGQQSPGDSSPDQTSSPPPA